MHGHCSLKKRYCHLVGVTGVDRAQEFIASSAMSLPALSALTPANATPKRAIFVHGPLCTASVPSGTPQGSVHSCSPFLRPRALLAFTALSSVSGPDKLVLWAAAAANRKKCLRSGVGGAHLQPLLCTPTQVMTAKQNLRTLESSESLHDDGGRASESGYKEENHTQRKSGRIRLEVQGQ